jgi:hypothetical protein
VITGYRRYNLVDHGTSDFELVGAHNTWPDREMTATCGYEDLSSVDRCETHLLDGMCSCGIYVLKTPDGISHYNRWPAIVAVTGWGAYTEYELGYRVQHVRMEHIWIEPEWIESIKREWDLDVFMLLLKSRYEVGVEVRQSALCCGQKHEMAYWPSKNGSVPLCQMSTSHIVNALRYLGGSAGRRFGFAAKWKLVLETELKRRTDQFVGSKVVF